MSAVADPSRSFRLAAAATDGQSVDVHAVAERDATLLANVWDAVIVTDLHGVVTYWNEGATRLFGYAVDEVLARPYADRLPEPERAAVADWIQKIAAGRAEFSGEWLDWRKDGSRVWIEANTRLIRDRTGMPVGIMGISRDISERKRQEAEIIAAKEAALAAKEAAETAKAAAEAAKEAALAANSAKDRFLAVLSHELRTPLSPILMTVAAMEQSPDLPPSLRDDVEMIRRNIELETKLIDDLLDVSRVINGKLRLDMQPTRLNDLLRHVAANCAGEMQENKRLHLHCDLRAANDLVEGDPARLQQVFWNIVRNAIKFTPEGGDVTLRTSNDGDGRLRVEVCDTGAGIAPGMLPRIFDAFEQGEIKTNHQVRGLGLGLAIAKAVVEMHGGSIRAESAGPGQGATFVVELRTAVAASPSDAASPQRDGEEAARRARILLVEDHADTARVLARLLERSGYSVETAGSVAAALDLAAARPFDVVISDIGLPDATGYELMRQVRDLHGLKGIALTGYGMEDDLRASRDAGFVEHVVKPVNVSQLETVIRRVTAPK